MTTRSPDRLFDLLPVVHRRRDAEIGHPLRALLQVIAEQADVVEDDLEQLYENWFIETCEDWVVPYLAELIGYRVAHEAGEPGGVPEARLRALRKILIPRREVANTLAWRRRKGTLPLLELLAHDVAGWPARAVEFYRLLGWFQPLNHQRLHRGRTADMRNGDSLDLIDGPFDRTAHTVDVRRIGSHRTPGRQNIPSVGLFIWRLKAYPVTNAPACCIEEIGSHCYTFSVLGNDAPLFTRPSPEPSPDRIAGPLNVPAPIRRRALQSGLADYYGPGRSFEIRVDGWAGHSPDAPLPPEAILVADLTGWAYHPPRDHVAVDPVLGRIAFPLRQLPKESVRVSYHYGFSDDMDGGEYLRPLSQPEGAVVYRVGEEEAFVRINDALARWREESPVHAVVELAGGVYAEQIGIDLEEGQSLQLRAADRARPILRLMDWQTARPDALRIRGAAGSRFTLDGVLVTGRSVRCEGELGEVTVRHCTLVPGWTIGSDCEPRRPAEPCLELIDTSACVTIERSIVGSIQVNQDQVRTDPVALCISESVVDATSPEREAIGAPGWPLAHVVLTVDRTTVFGQIHAHAIRLAENSIFLGSVTVARRQSGCVRFCYVSPGSRTPRRYRCQPDLVEEAARPADPPVGDSAALLAERLRRERQRVLPRFTSVRYGDPGYAQLALTAPVEITMGADDESEMGAFHDLFQPQRLANLQARLAEFSPAGTEAGVVMET